MHPRRCALLLSLLLGTPLLLFAQAAAAPGTAGQPILRATAQTVVVDVVVTGKNGKPVTGLHKEDFTAAEDGHPQELRFFEEHTLASQPPKSLPPLPVNVFTNIPRVTPADSVTVLLLDALNTPLEAQTFVRGQMLKYLKGLQPGRRIAIFALGNQLRFIQGFTDDSGLLIAALKNSKNGSTPQTSSVLQSHGEIASQQQALSLLAEHAASAAAALKQFQAEQAAAQNDLRVTMTLEAFQQLASYLAGIPGRKNLVWFSSAFPVVLFPNPNINDAFATQRDQSEQVRKTDALLTAAQVAIYPLAAEGLATDALNNADQQFGAVVTGQMGAQPSTAQMHQGMAGGQKAQAEQGNSLHADASQRNANHASMDEIAQETGGEAIYNTNGLDQALARVEENGSHYYTLAYTPSNGIADGRFRKIDIKLTKGADKLAYRRGYFASDAKGLQVVAPAPVDAHATQGATPAPASPAPAPADPMLRYMLPGLPDSTQIALGLRIQPEAAPAAAGGSASTASARAGDNAQLKGALTRYAIDFVIAARGLQLAPTADGGRTGQIEATIVVYGTGGKAQNWMVRQLDLTMDAARYKTVLSSGVNFRLEIDAPKEAVTLRSGVYDLNAHRAGTLEIPLASLVATAQKTSSKP